MEPPVLSQCRGDIRVGKLEDVNESVVYWLRVLCYVSSINQWRIQNFLKGGAEDKLSAPSSFIANAHNEIYAFYTEKATF